MQLAICTFFIDMQYVEHWQMCKWDEHAILWSWYPGDLLMFLWMMLCGLAHNQFPFPHRECSWPHLCSKGFCDRIKGLCDQAKGLCDQIKGPWDTAKERSASTIHITWYALACPTPCPYSTSAAGLIQWDTRYLLPTITWHISQHSIQQSAAWIIYPCCPTVYDTCTTTQLTSLPGWWALTTWRTLPE